MKPDYQSVLSEARLLTRGIYSLIVHVDTDRTLRIGKRYSMNFPEGNYAYVGSAMAGFGNRLGHHFRGAARPRWHIDYLLQNAVICSVVMCETDNKAECILAKALLKRFESVARFGSSDCRCRSHLFYSVDKEHLSAGIVKTINDLDYRADLIDIN